LNRLLTYRYYGYPDDFIFQYQKAVAGVTREEVLRVAKQYLDPTKFVVVATGNPKDFGTPLSAMGKPVSDIDLTIPEPKKEQTKADPAAAERGKAILAKARAAMGGTAAIAAVKDATESNSIQLDQAAGGLKAEQTAYWISPDQFRQDNVLPFGKVSTYSDGKMGWMATPQGVQPVPAAQLKQVQFETFRVWFSLMQSDLNSERTVSDLGGGKVEISDKAGDSVVMTFDAGTGLPATETYSQAGGTGGTVMEAYADWRESNGVKLPRKITMMQDGHHYLDITVNDVSLNKGLTSEQISKKP
jgi:outer membrane lipoprotein-sorting protein